MWENRKEKMAANFGKNYKISIFGESHGSALGVCCEIIDIFLSHIYYLTTNIKKALSQQMVDF